MGETFKRIMVSAAGSLLAKIVFGSLAAGFFTMIFLSWDHVLTSPLPLQVLIGFAFLMLLAVVGLLVALWLMSPTSAGYAPKYWVWYSNPLRKISWRPNSVGIAVLMGNPAVIPNFHCSFRVNRGRITPKRLFLRFFGGQVLHLTVNDRPVSDYEFILSGTWNNCSARILKPKLPDDGNVTNHPSIDQFFAIFGGFELIFEYDNTEFRRTYSTAELKRAINHNLQQMRPDATPRAVLRDREDAAGA